MVLQDVTEAVEADRAKNAFIATASHEMRTPLASMKGFVDIFYMSGIENLSENQRLFLDAIKRQTENLVVMVNDLLEVARLEQAPSVAERRWVSPIGVIEECVTNLSTQIQQRHINLMIDASQGLPYIWIDALHMRRILINMLSNAVKYVHQGGYIQVRVYPLNNPALLPSTPDDQPWKAQEERSVVIEVEDNGVGIRTSDQQKIFTRFFRSDNPLSVEAGGSGLGLSITKSLVLLHNGQIGFRSIEGRGTCFWVRFPAPFTEQLTNEGEHSLGEGATLPR
jgi:signal transduction histidine kinase